MLNVNTRIEGTKLVIEVDLTKRFGPSSSGKTTIVASTQGNSKLPGPHDKVQFGLNVYTKQ